MRRIVMFLPVLCCLALFARQSAAQDVTRVKDKSKEWKEGSVWKGIRKAKSPDGKENSQDVAAVVTKRDGNSFEGRFEFEDGAIVLDFEGDVDGTGKMNITIMKIAKASDEFKKGITAQNVVGVKTPGAIDGKSVILNYARASADNPKGVRTHVTIKLNLKTDD